jgi:hypothetical protein
MNALYTNDTLGFLLGALAIRADHEITTLAMVQANLEHVKPTSVRQQLVVAAQLLASAEVVVSNGNLNDVESTHVQLARKPPVVIRFDHVAEPFVLGAMALYYNPLLVQVSQIRQAAERLWPKPEVFNSIYLVVGALLEKGLIVSHFRGGDRDQLHVSFPYSDTPRT